MSKAQTAVSADEPNDQYDQLSLDEQDAFDWIAGAGFKPVAAGRGWAAEPVQEGGTKIGPFPDLFQLKDAVVEASGIVEDEIGEATEEFTLDGGDMLHNMASESNGNGKTVKVKQPLLPNTENMVLQNLRESLLAYRATTMEILALQTRQKEERKLGTALMHKFEDELSVDKETGFKFYMVETIKFVLETTVTEKLKTEQVSY